MVLMARQNELEPDRQIRNVTAQLFEKTEERPLGLGIGVIVPDVDDVAGPDGLDQLFQRRGRSVAAYVPLVLTLIEEEAAFADHGLAANEGVVARKDPFLDLQELLPRGKLGFQ